MAPSERAGPRDELTLVPARRRLRPRTGRGGGGPAPRSSAESSGNSADGASTAGATDGALARRERADGATSRPLAPGRGGKDGEAATSPPPTESLNRGAGVASPEAPRRGAGAASPEAPRRGAGAASPEVPGLPSLAASGAREPPRADARDASPVSPLRLEPDDRVSPSAPPRALAASGPAAPGTRAWRRRVDLDALAREARAASTRVGPHLRELRRQQDLLPPSQRESYSLEHARSLAEFAPRRPYQRPRDRRLCSKAHPQPCPYGCRTCHFCRQRLVERKTACPRCDGMNNAFGGPARGVWCGACLWLRIGENIDEVIDDPAWRCPGCRDVCNCSGANCQRLKRGWFATNQLSHEAAAMGFASVAHYLVLTLVGEREDELEAAKARLREAEEQRGGRRRRGRGGTNRAGGGRRRPGARPVAGEPAGGRAGAEGTSSEGSTGDDESSSDADAGPPAQDRAMELGLSPARGVIFAIDDDDDDDDDDDGDSGLPWLYRGRRSALPTAREGVLALPEGEADGKVDALSRGAPLARRRGYASSRMLQTRLDLSTPPASRDDSFRSTPLALESLEERAAQRLRPLLSLDQPSAGPSRRGTLRGFRTRRDLLREACAPLVDWATAEIDAELADGEGDDAPGGDGGFGALFDGGVGARGAGRAPETVRRATAPLRGKPPATSRSAVTEGDENASLRGNGLPLSSLGPSRFAVLGADRSDAVARAASGVPLAPAVPTFQMFLEADMAGDGEEDDWEGWTVLTRGLQAVPVGRTDERMDGTAASSRGVGELSASSSLDRSRPRSTPPRTHEVPDSFAPSRLQAESDRGAGGGRGPGLGGSDLRASPSSSRGQMPPPPRRSSSFASTLFPVARAPRQATLSWRRPGGARRTRLPGAADSQRSATVGRLSGPTAGAEGAMRSRTAGSDEREASEAVAADLCAEARARRGAIPPAPRDDETPHPRGRSFPPGVSLPAAPSSDAFLSVASPCPGCSNASSFVQSAPSAAPIRAACVTAGSSAVRSSEPSAARTLSAALSEGTGALSSAIDDSGATADARRGGDRSPAASSADPVPLLGVGLLATWEELFLAAEAVAAHLGSLHESRESVDVREMWADLGVDVESVYEAEYARGTEALIRIWSKARAMLGETLRARVVRAESSIEEPSACDAGHFPIAWSAASATAVQAPGSTGGSSGPSSRPSDASPVLDPAPLRRAPVPAPHRREALRLAARLCAFFARALPPALASGAAGPLAALSEELVGGWADGLGLGRVGAPARDASATADALADGADAPPASFGAPGLAAPNLGAGSSSADVPLSQAERTAGLSRARSTVRSDGATPPLALLDELERGIVLRALVDCAATFRARRGEETQDGPVAGGNSPATDGPWRSPALYRLALAASASVLAREVSRATYILERYADAGEMPPLRTSVGPAWTFAPAKARSGAGLSGTAVLVQMTTLAARVAGLCRLQAWVLERLRVEGARDDQEMRTALELARAGLTPGDAAAGLHSAEGAGAASPATLDALSRLLPGCACACVVLATPGLSAALADPFERAPKGARDAGLRTVEEAVRRLARSAAVRGAAAEVLATGAAPQAGVDFGDRVLGTLEWLRGDAAGGASGSTSRPEASAAALLSGAWKELDDLSRALQAVVTLDYPLWGKADALVRGGQTVASGASSTQTPGVPVSDRLSSPTSEPSATSTPFAGFIPRPAPPPSLSYASPQAMPVLAQVWAAQLWRGTLTWPSLEALICRPHGPRRFWAKANRTYRHVACFLFAGTLDAWEERRKDAEGVVLAGALLGEGATRGDRPGRAAPSLPSATRPGAPAVLPRPPPPWLPIRIWALSQIETGSRLCAWYVTRSLARTVPTDRWFVDVRDRIAAPDAFVADAGASARVRIAQAVGLALAARAPAAGLGAFVSGVVSRPGGGLALAAQAASGDGPLAGFAGGSSSLLVVGGPSAAPQTPPLPTSLQPQFAQLLGDVEDVLKAREAEAAATAPVAPLAAAGRYRACASAVVMALLEGAVLGLSAGSVTGAAPLHLSAAQGAAASHLSAAQGAAASHLSAAQGAAASHLSAAQGAAASHLSAARPPRLLEALGSSTDSLLSLVGAWAARSLEEARAHARAALERGAAAEWSDASALGEESAAQLVRKAEAAGTTAEPTASGRLAGPRPLPPRALLEALSSTPLSLAPVVWRLAEALPPDAAGATRGLATLRELFSAVVERAGSSAAPRVGGAAEQRDARDVDSAAALLLAYSLLDGETGGLDRALDRATGVSTRVAARLAAREHLTLAFASLARRPLARAALGARAGADRAASACLALLEWTVALDPSGAGGSHAALLSLSRPLLDVLAAPEASVQVRCCIFETLGRVATTAGRRERATAEAAGSRLRSPFFVAPLDLFWSAVASAALERVAAPLPADLLVQARRRVALRAPKLISAGRPAPLGADGGDATGRSSPLTSSRSDGAGGRGSGDARGGGSGRGATPGRGAARGNAPPEVLGPHAALAAALAPAGLLARNALVGAAPRPREASVAVLGRLVDPAASLVVAGAAARDPPDAQWRLASAALATLACLAAIVPPPGPHPAFALVHFLVAGGGARARPLAGGYRELRAACCGADAESVDAFPLASGPRGGGGRGSGDARNPGRAPSTSGLEPDARRAHEAPVRSAQPVASSISGFGGLSPARRDSGTASRSPNPTDAAEGVGESFGAEVVGEGGGEVEPAPLGRAPAASALASVVVVGDRAYGAARLPGAGGGGGASVGASSPGFYPGAARSRSFVPHPAPSASVVVLDDGGGETALSSQAARSAMAGRFAGGGDASKARGPPDALSQAPGAPAMGALPASAHAQSTQLALAESPRARGAQLGSVESVRARQPSRLRPQDVVAVRGALDPRIVVKRRHDGSEFHLVTLRDGVRGPVHARLIVTHEDEGVSGRGSRTPSSGAAPRAVNPIAALLMGAERGTWIEARGFRCVRLEPHLSLRSTPESAVEILGVERSPQDDGPSHSGSGASGQGSGGRAGGASSASQEEGRETTPPPTTGADPLGFWGGAVDVEDGVSQC